MKGKIFSFESSHNSHIIWRCPYHAFLAVISRMSVSGAELIFVWLAATVLVLPDLPYCLFRDRLVLNGVGGYVQLTALVIFARATLTPLMSDMCLRVRSPQEGSHQGKSWRRCQGTRPVQDPQWWKSTQPITMSPWSNVWIGGNRRRLEEVKKASLLKRSI